MNAKLVLYKWFTDGWWLCGVFCLLLLTTFVADQDFAEYWTTSMRLWIYLTVPLCVLCAIIGFGVKRKIGIGITMADGCATLLLIISLATYDYALDAAPKQLVVVGLLYCLWWTIRLGLETYQRMRVMLFCCLLVLGLMSASFGVLQLMGIKQSLHSLFPVTGSFYNPGPYCGFISLFLPLAVWVVLKYNVIELFKWWRPVSWLYILAYGVIIASILVLPATMSRIGWLASAVSVLFVCWHELRWKSSVLRWVVSSKLSFYISLCSLVCLLIVAVSGLFVMKKDSANGRLLMWKVASNVVLEAPFRGVGLGCFSGEYGKGQHAYFDRGIASEQEMYVAGTPEYGFNEYLQLAMELGLLGLFTFLLLIGYCFFCSYRNREYGICGAYISLLIFSFASYPLRLLPFWIALIFLCALSVSRSDTRHKKSQIHLGYKTTLVLGMICLMMSSYTLYLRKGEYKAYRAWKALQRYTLTTFNEKDRPYYDSLYPILQSEPKFLFEYAQFLIGTENRDEANTVLERGVMLSCDPMFHNVKARNHQALGEFKEAEYHLRYAATMLPYRVYPYYLLTKLYAEDAYYDKAKLKDCAQKVMMMEPKVQSTAIKEMRKEIKEILQSVQ